jgi:hypothetical protein
MRRTFLLALSMTALTAVAQQNYATRSFALPCSELKPAAISFFQRNGLILNPDTACDGCFIGATNHPQDPRGHGISAHTALKHYTEDASRGGKDVVGAWYVHTGLTTTAKLKLQPAGEGSCQASLLFFYLWYATEFIVAMPVDGDPASRPSNLRLENEYLQALADKLTQTSPHL